LEIGGVVVFTVIGGAIGGPIGAAVGMVVAGGIGLLEGYESERYKFEGYKFLSNKLREIGANKVFADQVVTPVLKLILKPLKIIFI
jgi:predicted TIM-barrel enzyme